MRADQMVTSRVEENREAPRISEGDQMRLPREVIDTNDSKARNLLARDLRILNPGPLFRIEVYTPTLGTRLRSLWEGVTYKK